MQSEELSWLREAINELHSGESRYIGTVPVKESFAGQIDWEGPCRWRRTFDNRLALPVCFLR